MRGSRLFLVKVGDLGGGGGVGRGGALYLYYVNFKLLKIFQGEGFWTLSSSTCDYKEFVSCQIIYIYILVG